MDISFKRYYRLNVITESVPTKVSINLTVKVQEKKELFDLNWPNQFLVPGNVVTYWVKT
jgi:hypothetical protein